MKYGWKNLANTRKQGKKGFTIVEVTVVIVIIGILATVTAVSYNAITGNARVETAKADAQTVASQLRKYKATHGDFPATADFDSAKVTSNTSSEFEYHNDGGGTFCLTVTYYQAVFYVTHRDTTPQEGECPVVG